MYRAIPPPSPATSQNCARNSPSSRSLRLICFPKLRRSKWWRTSGPRHQHNRPGPNSRNYSCRCINCCFSSKGLLLRARAKQTEKFMCLALYIAASKPLPVVPWDPKRPAFHVVPLPEDMEDVRSLLPYPHIYYVGSHEGCSCAFNYEHE